MKPEHIVKLKEQAKYTGFGESIHVDIDQGIASGEADFHPEFVPEYDSRARFTANFRKSDQDDYFFNSFELEINKGDNKVMRQSFYVNRAQQLPHEGSGGKVQTVNTTITTKEAWNLMNGRAILKDQVKFMKAEDGSQIDEKIAYKCWLRLDLSVKHPQTGNYKIARLYNFDLIKALNELGIEPDEQLVRKLQKGELAAHVVTEREGQKTYHLAANPAYKTVKIFDENGMVVKNKLNLKVDAPAKKATETEDVKKKHSTKVTPSDSSTKKSLSQAKPRKRGKSVS